MKNVGRQVLELAIKHLPNLLLHYHCDDLSHGRSHANGTVFTSIFQNSPFTVSDLEAAQLWQRMDVKIAQRGALRACPSRHLRHLMSANKAKRSSAAC